MNNYNKKKLWLLITKQGDLLKNKLPVHPSHPSGRNPYAHVCSSIKIHFKMTYKDIPNKLFYEVKKFIEKIEN